MTTAINEINSNEETCQNGSQKSEFGGNRKKLSLEKAIELRSRCLIEKLSVYDLSEQYGISPHQVRNILNGESYKLAFATDNYGRISPTKHTKKVLAGISYLLHSVGFFYKDIAEYLNLSRAYAHKLSVENNLSKNVLVPIVLMEDTKSKSSKKIGAGLYYLQLIERGGRFLLIYKEPGDMPQFISPGELKKCRKIIADEPVIEH